ncbi:MAG: TrmB family transcriptional regulator, partial [Oscillochloris sp.]|nr:TrmB family transcriptional regulator [Oscillochloris sp.]
MNDARRNYGEGSIVSDTLLETLGRLGFSLYESRVYCALLQQSPCNGHEVSKASGVPPSKVYETLQRLQAKGAVLVYHSEPVRYAAVPYHTVLDGLRRRFTADMEFAETNLGALPVSHDPGLTWSLQQRASILSTCVQAIQSAQRVIYAALWDA